MRRALFDARAGVPVVRHLICAAMVSGAATGAGDWILAGHVGGVRAAVDNASGLEQEAFTAFDELKRRFGCGNWPRGLECERQRLWPADPASPAG
jgi:hypothetical protein